MKKLLIFSIILLASGSIAQGGFVSPAQPALKPTTQQLAVQSALQTKKEDKTTSASVKNSLDIVRTNIGLIIGKAQQLGPRLQEIINQTSGQGGVTGYFSALFTIGTDTELRNGIMALLAEAKRATSEIADLIQTDPFVTEHVRPILARLSQSEAVRNLVDKVQQVPIVGNLLHERLNELISGSLLPVKEIVAPPASYKAMGDANNQVVDVASSHKELLNNLVAPQPPARTITPPPVPDRGLSKTPPVPPVRSMPIQKPVRPLPQLPVRSQEFQQQSPAPISLLEEIRKGKTLKPTAPVVRQPASSADKIREGLKKNELIDKYQRNYGQGIQEASENDQAWGE